MIKIGQSTHAWWLNGDLKRLDEELQEIQMAGADSCELILHGLDVVIGGRIIHSRLEAALKILRKYKLEYTLHLPYDLNLLDTDMLEQYVRVFQAGIAFAQAAGIGVIVYHPGKMRFLGPAALQREAEQIRRLVKTAPDILFCMENAPLFNREESSAAKNAEAMIAFCEMVDLPNFGLTFDVGHCFLAHQGNKHALLRDLERLLPFIGHIHLHDNCGVNLEMSAYDYNHRIACGAADLHLPLGWGRIPIEDVLNRLGSYQGIVNLEIEHRFRSQYSACISFVREYLAKHVQPSSAA